MVQRTCPSASEPPVSKVQTLTPTQTPNPNPAPKQPVAKMRLQTTGKETMNCYVYINTARLPAST